MTEKEKNSIPVDLITRYFSGEANTDDIIDLERWKAVSEENRSTFEQYRRIWESTGELTIFTDIDIDIDHEWETFLNATTEDTQPVETKSVIHLIPLLLRVSAVVVIGLLLGYSGLFLYHAFSYEKIAAVSGKITVDLPDGTEVVLNKGSVLEYPRKFEKTQRQVKLNGEAFFNVHRDISRPFSVHSGSFRLQVLGTSFNIVAWKNKNIVEVTVKTGEVEIYPRNREEVRQILPPGQKGYYSRKSKEITRMPNQDNNYDSWVTGHMEFKNTSLLKVISTLESVYNVRFQFENSDLRTCRITESFDNSPLPLVLESIGETLGIDVEERNGTIFLSGDGC